MDKKAQVAVEFLTTYGWVIVCVLILTAVMLYYGVFDPLRFVSRQCNFEPGLPCTTYKLESNPATGGATYIVQLSNDLGYDISLSNGSILLNVENVGKPGKNTYVGNCSPMSPAIIKKGATFTCIINITDRSLIPSIGKNIKLQPVLNYQNCLTAPNYLTTGDCSFASNQTSAGTVITQMEPYSETLYCGDGICSPQIGENPATCPADCSIGSISLSANPATGVIPDGLTTSTITARVFDTTGNPIDGVLVSFSTTLGTLTVLSTISTNGGYAVTQIYSNVIGTAAITANAMGHSNTTTVKFEPLPATFIFNPPSSFCNGTSLDLTATLRDQNGNPMSGYIVTFGKNSSNGRFTQNPVATDISGGNANTTFTGDTTVEQLQLTASVADPNTGQVLFTQTRSVQSQDCSGSGGCPDYVDGDWHITTDVFCWNKTINVTGRIIIDPGASLTLRGATINFSCSGHSLSGPGGLYNSGTFNMIEDTNGQPSALVCNTTFLDCCEGDAYCVSNPFNPASPSSGRETGPGQRCYKCITHCNVGVPNFPLVNNAGSSFTAMNSTIRQAGQVPWLGILGPSIASDNAIVQGMDISNGPGTSCLIVYGSNAQILNNKIHDCVAYGIDVTSSCPSSISCPSSPPKNTYIYGNEIYRVYRDGGNVGIGINIDPYVSYTNIVNNYVHNNPVGIQVADDDCYAPPAFCPYTNHHNTITGNNIRSNVEGIRVWQHNYANLASNNIQYNTYGVNCSNPGDKYYGAIADFSLDQVSDNSVDDCSTCNPITCTAPCDGVLGATHGGTCTSGAPAPTPCPHTYIAGYLKLTTDYKYTSGPGYAACFYITGTSSVLDCDGHALIGDGTANSFGVYSSNYGFYLTTTIKNCTIINFANGISLQDSKNSIIDHNTITTSQVLGGQKTNGIELYKYITSLTPQYNTISANSISGAYTGILDGNSTYDKITSNTVSSAYDAGIFLDGVTQLNLTGNYVSSNTYDGVYIFNSTSLKISSNTVSSSSLGSGIHFEFPNTPQYTNGNTITSNTIQANGNYGVKCVDLSGNPVAFTDPNTFIGNTITGNGPSGDPLANCDSCGGGCPG